MAVQTKNATISIATADTVGSTQTITCDFEPKVIIAFAAGNASATDNLASGSVHGSVGFAVSTSERASVAMMSTNGSATVNDGRIGRNDAVLCQVLGNGSVGSLLDISAIDSTSFTVIVDDQFTVASRVSFLAIGGSDITNASIGWLTAPTSTGTFDVTSLAFQPDFVLMIACAQDSDANFTSNARSNLMIGVATAAGQRVMAAAQGPESNADSQSRGYSYDGECVAILADTPTSIGCRASFTEFLSNGFRLNFLEAGTAYRVAYLAVKGGQWRLDDFLSSTTQDATIAESGFGFDPVGGMVFSHGSGKSTQDTVQNQSRMSVGAFSSATERVAQAFLIQDAQATTSNYRGIEHDSVVLRVSDTGTLDGLIDVSSIDSGGVTFAQDDADSNQAYVWYWVVGNNAAGGTTVTLSDSGAGSDSLSVAVGAGIADSGTGVDVTLPETLAQLIDSAAATDLIAQITSVLAVLDGGSGADDQSTNAYLAVSDSIVVVESAGVAAVLYVTDDGSGVDQVALLSDTLKSILDSASGNESVQITVAILETDIGVGTEESGATIQLSVYDEGAGVDTLLVSVLAQIVEVANGADSVGNITVNLPVADIANVVDALTQIAATLSVLEIGSGIDIAVKFDAAVKIVSISFSWTKRSVQWSFTKRTIDFSFAR